jgi:hypothetical protein
MIFGTHEDMIGQSIIKWYEGRIKDDITPPYSCFAWVNQWGAYTSAVMFNDFRVSKQKESANIEVHLQSEKKISRNLLETVAVYVFDTLKCTRLTAKPHRSNKKLLQLLPRIGFKYECTLKRYYGPSKEDDALVFCMFKEDAQKWVR